MIKIFTEDSGVQRSMAVSFQCMTKFTTNKKIIIN